MERQNTVSSFVENHFNLIATLGIFLAITASASELAPGILGRLIAVVFCGASIVVWLEVLALMGEPKGGTLQPIFLLLSCGLVLFCLFELKILLDDASRLAWAIPWLLLVALAGKYVDRLERAWKGRGLPRGGLLLVMLVYMFGSMAALIRWVDPGHIRLLVAWLGRLL